MNKRWLLVSGLFVLLCWFLIAGINRFPYPAQGKYSDFTISHYPNVLFTQQAIHTWHQLPLWNNTILSGYPYAADPLASIWYPPYWIAILFPHPFGLNLLTFLHLVCGALGMMKFLQAMGVKDFAAFTGAIVFLLMPKLFAHIGAGHVTLVWAVCLTPWLLYFENRSKTTLRFDKSKIWTTLFATGIVLADVRWAVMVWILWMLFAFWGTQEANLAKKQLSSGLFLKMVWLKFRQGLLTFLLASPLLLPLLQFIYYSTRNGLEPQDSLVLSLPPAQLIGVLYPNFAGSAEWTVYFGAIPVLLLVVILTSRASWLKARFWVVVFFVSLVISLGEALPGAEFVAALPGFSLLRVPPRALFLTGISLAVLTGFGMQALTEKGIVLNKRIMRLGLVGYISLVSVLTIVLGIAASKPAGFLWGGGLTFVAGVFLLIFAGLKQKHDVLLVFLTCILILDLGYSSFTMLSFKAGSEVFAESNELASAIQTSQKIPGRVYSPSYSLPQEVAAKNGLHLADGINPLQLATYVEYMQSATNVYSDKYSVTLPAFSTGTPETDNIPAEPDAILLGFLNVSTVVAAFPLDVEGLQLRVETARAFVYENTKARPAAWIQAGFALDENEHIQPAEVVINSPNKVVIQATGPGVLVLSDPMYPGWIANMDGISTKVETVGGLLRGITLPVGDHTVKFFFRPLLVYLGCVLQIMALVGIFFFSSSNQKKSSSFVFMKAAEEGKRENKVK